MKNAKKFAGLLLALIMVFALAAPTFADDPATTTKYTITITPANPGHTFTAYQVFKGDLSEKGTTATLSNVQWGDNINSAALIADSDLATALPALAGKANPTAADVADALSATGADANKFAKIAQKHTTGTGTASGAFNTEAKSYTISNLDAGYYLIVDTTANLPENDSYSGYILQVVKNIEVIPKGSTPSVVKKVKDINDSTGIETGWQDSADYDIGDRVPFQLTATLGDINPYETYKVVFHDTLSEGLTLDKDSITVKVANTTLTTAQFSVVTENLGHTHKDAANAADGDQPFDIVITDVKALGAKDRDVITVEYTATLNRNAVIGSAGNPNEVYLEYSNNPNAEGTGKTPKDKVTVFTFKFVVNKTDASGNPLTGAGFTLYKQNSDGQYVAVGEEKTGTNMTTFTWEGIDNGNYKLSETTTPPGFNTMADVEFTVTAEHDQTADDPQLTSLYVPTFVTGPINGDVQTGTLTTTVVNNSGSVLPGTGGIGTTIFYIVGSVLLVGAAVLLITKKRVSAEEK